MDPLLKWAGSKRWQVPALQNIWNAGHTWRKLIEPFCGGCNVVLGLNPNAALLNDANPHVINFYRWVQAGVPFCTGTFKAELYYEYRNEFNRLIAQDGHTTLPAAELFYALNHWCFNGLCRFNAKGYFNTPPRPICRPLPTFDAVEYRAVMAGWEFTSHDWRKIAVADDDFIYADPPYDGGYTRYTGDDFTWDDQRDLAIWLSAHGGPVILMNKATPRILKLYDSLGFTITLVDAQQRMHLSRGRTGSILEVMATNPTLDPRDIMETI